MTVQKPTPADNIYILGTGCLLAMIMVFAYKGQILKSVTSAAMALILGSLWLLVMQVLASDWSILSSTCDAGQGRHQDIGDCSE